MKTLRLILTLLLFATPLTNSYAKTLSVLVVTGGHRYDTPEFEEMFRSMEGIHASFVTTEEMQAMSANQIAEHYDALVLLDMVKARVADSAKQQYYDLTQSGVGMVFLHFSVASRPYWNEYHDIIGGKFFLKRFTADKSRVSTYWTDLTVQVTIADKNHPVTRGLADFTITDAFYGNIYIADSVKPLLTTDHPKVAKTIAWENKYGRSKVIYLMPGFTRSAYTNPSYRKFVRNALFYVSR